MKANRVKTNVQDYIFKMSSQHFRRHEWFQVSKRKSNSIIAPEYPNDGNCEIRRERQVKVVCVLCVQLVCQDTQTSDRLLMVNLLCESESGPFTRVSN